MWNVAAVVLMTLADPMGGILCVSEVESSCWSDLLKRGVKTGLIELLRELGLSYRFEPELWMVDSDLHRGCCLWGVGSPASC